MRWPGRSLGVGVGLCVVLGAAAGEVARRPKTALPDTLTPVLVRPVSSIVAPVLGGDGRYHVVYELWLTNAKALPATLSTPASVSLPAAPDSRASGRCCGPNCKTESQSRSSA